jgi:glycosyltransferase involved in cell wall biosynthesis
MKKFDTIGIFHYQLGSTDGVSLEVEKWKTVLERLGHKVIFVAGRLGSQDGILLPALYHHREDIALINHMIRGESQALSPSEIEVLISQRTQELVTQIKEVILENSIGILLVNNIWSVGLHLPAAIALDQVRRDLDLSTIAHHHDFYWERKIPIPENLKKVKEITDCYLPPLDSNIKHVVINCIAKKELKKRKGIQASVIPNVFDFAGPDWVVDDYNRDLREVIGLKQNDICLLQGTRIIPRKGIELSIDLVRALNAPHRRSELENQGLFDGSPFNLENKIVLVLAGYDRDDPTGEYLNKLKRKAKALEVDLRHIDPIIGPERKLTDQSKIYSLWDAYTIADFVTYPSLWEGWGNQFLEALKAKLPMVIFEYPVYIQDIKDKGFNVVSLGSEAAGRDHDGLVQIPQAVIEKAADQCVDYLTNRHQREKMVEENYKIGAENYSYDRLGYHLENLLE